MARRLALAALAALGLATSAARAQTPAPIVADVNQRSGLITRMTPIIPSLPADPDRDIYQNTRWADQHETQHRNAVTNGGLYGRKWKTGCTACFTPYFRGSPGMSTLGPDCLPSNFRLLSNFVHPFKPVDTYYSGGCFVPVYDLDPTVPGPGPFPFPRLYLRKPLGG